MTRHEEFTANALDVAREHQASMVGRYKWMKHYLAISGTLYDGGDLAIRVTKMDGSGRPLQTELLGWAQLKCDHQRCVLSHIMESGSQHLAQLLEEALVEAAKPLDGQAGVVDS